MVRPSVILCLSIASLPAYAGTPVITAPDPVRDMLTRYVSLRDSAGVPSLAAEEQRLRNEIDELLGTSGYFSPDIVFDWHTDPPQITVTPGTPTTVRTVELDVEGDIPPELLTRLRQQWTLHTGQTFTQQAWDDAKLEAQQALLEAGYAGAALTHSAAEVHPEASAADLHIRFRSGPRYRFGALQLSGLRRYDEDLVQRYNHSVVTGAVYRASALLALQHALQNSPYFSAAQISLGPATAPAADGSVTAPVLVQMSERTPHALGAGIGASSNTGARVEASFSTNDLAGQAWRLNTALRLEQLRQGAFADVFLPPLADQRQLSFGSLRENTDIQGLKTSRLGLAARLSRHDADLTHIWSLDWQQEHRRPADATSSSDRALALNSTWIWHTDSAERPELGETLNLQVGGGSRAVLSDQNFVRLYARYQRGFELGPDDTLAIRVEAGMTRAPSRDGIPQDFLFRAGGAGSVRGYAYDSLGVSEGHATVGGRYLSTASIEQTHWWGSWGLATFVDAGDARDSWQPSRLALGYGLGGRWRSPAGPLGLDLAYGQRTHEFHLHFAFSVPF